MDLTTIWFLAIAILFTGYFVLEGFDFGVGMLLPVLGRDDRERRLAINTIGPVWDGNETWVITAGGAMFAAFPVWYSSLFSGFYLLLFLILIALIVRGVAFEYRAKGKTERWKATWDRSIFWCSLAASLLWGMVVGNMVYGVALDADHYYVGSFWELFNLPALLGAATFVLLFAGHGATFLSLKTKGEFSQRAHSLAWKLSTVGALPAAVWLVWMQTHSGSVLSGVFIAVAVASLLTSIVCNLIGRDGFSFSFTAATIAFASAGLFAALWPNVMPSTIQPSYSLTHENAAATELTLTIMSWAGAIFLPVVLLYQGWTYWVFRKRMSVENIPA
ncbi:cytochrome d ubiquinol oxidase subunit II [Haloglycomyces albus]|uniref:cytochrome d ubiquinol oxidase subunit II n=1 Tax=Haloglycomyces albus TaxID=526067 RepID=UPI00046D8300|nr:cytochrome d ubiquinol oxidase subunit II [Haloglycomyces albus]